MILQALTDYYRRKCDDPDPAQRLPAFGLEQKEIPFILEINAEGELLQLRDTRELHGKKKVARIYRVPMGIKKTSGVAANLLWDNAEYVLHKSRIRGSALYAKRAENAIIRLKDGTYTTCEPDSNAWQLKGNNITLNPATGFGTATNVTLRVKDIPVFYTPYIYFPIDDRRQSGFLPPSFSSSTDTGFMLVTPYYFNLAPNYDATLYPRYMTKRGLLMEGEFRYLTKSSEGQVGGAYLNDDNDERSKQTDFEKTRWIFLQPVLASMLLVIGVLWLIVLVRKIWAHAHRRRYVLGLRPVFKNALITLAVATMATFVLFGAGLGEVVMGVVKLAWGGAPAANPGMMYWSWPVIQMVCVVVVWAWSRVFMRLIEEATNRGLAQWPPRKGVIGAIVSGRQPVLASTRFGRVMFWITAVTMLYVLLVFAFWGLFIY